MLKKILHFHPYYLWPEKLTDEIFAFRGWRDVPRETQVNSFYTFKSLLSSISFKRCIPKKKFKSKNSNTPEVHLFRIFLLLYHFWTNIIKSPTYYIHKFSFLKQVRPAKVTYFYFSLSTCILFVPNHNVFWFQISMNNTLLMHIIHTFRNFFNDFSNFPFFRSE